MNKKLYFFLITFFLTNCQIKETYINNTENVVIKNKKTATNSNKKFEIDNQPTLLSLKNTYWVFDNYEDKINLKNIKVPTITFTDIDKKGIKFKGTTFLNFHQ